ncbi:hypothetical protein [Rhodoblastus sp.]|uniref:hypothetical protein n=1 Tax=Rhodoblastus sp. TaxID=1962975 RepID=UPI003F95B5BE
MTMESVEWLPWGQPRMTQRGVETAFHHPLIAIRVNGEAQSRVVNPGDLLSGPDRPEVESWRPMAWAALGRREWKSPVKLSPNTAFWGADQHLFHTNDAVCEQLFEGADIGADGEAEWRNVLRRRVEWCAARNITYRHLVIPEHHSIYADMIPDAPSLSENRPLPRIMKGLELQVRDTIVYPLNEMIAGRAKFDTSIRHDVHFTGYGCFLCYEALMKTLPGAAASELVREEDLRVREFFLAGDVAHAAGEPGQRITFHDPPKIAQRTIVKGASFQANQVDVYASDAPSGRSLVMFRTSNSSHLIPYFLRHFSRITAVGTRQFFYDLLESEKPDVVINEMPERYFAPAKASPDTNLYGFAPRDDAPFEKATGLSLPLPTE